MSDKKRGRPSKGNDSRISVRLSDKQLDTLVRVGHDYCIYDSSGKVNTSEVLRIMLDKMAEGKKELFEKNENGQILYDIIINSLDACVDDYRQLVELLSDNDSDMKDHYRKGMNFLARLALILESYNYNDNKPDVTQKSIAFLTDDDGNMITKMQERKVDKRYHHKLAVNNYVRQK